MKKMAQHSTGRRPNLGILMSGLAVAAVLTLLVATGLGPVSVAPGTVAKLLLSKIPFWGELISPTWKRMDETIVWGLRLPRVALGMVVGASLAVIGITMQALVRNRLADPFVLGVSSGASAFATLGRWLSWS